jgi:UDP-N-acetyl-D-glucosamine dehydrogenase
MSISVTEDSRRRPAIADPGSPGAQPTALGAAGQALKSRIERREACIAVIGLGYVGLPLCTTFLAAGHRVIGIDRDTRKIEMLAAGQPYLEHVGADLFSELRDNPRFEATTEESALARADAILICVPTPLGRHREPDMQFVERSTEMVARHLRTGQIVVLESTTYPGTTRDLCQPLLEAGGLRCGTDFFLAFSPEREDPGRKDFDTRTTPKVVGGIDDASGDLAEALFATAIQTVVRVDSAEIAESAKLLENIYRCVNIALVNELKPVLHDMGIDIWKVIAAASTKPFGFQPFYPGPGLGGHCIPIDPFYLTWRAKEFGHSTRFIELAGEINGLMPEYVVRRLVEGLNHRGKALRGARILVCGVAYKANIDDTRETPAAPIITHLLEAGAQVEYHDPHVVSFPRKRAYDIRMDSVALEAGSLRACDAVVILVRHSAVDYGLIAREADIVVDACNAMAAHMPIRGLRVEA